MSGNGKERDLFDATTVGYWIEVMLTGWLLALVIVAIVLGASWLLG